MPPGRTRFNATRPRTEAFQSPDGGTIVVGVGLGEVRKVRWNDCETLFSEVPVERRRGPDSEAPHQDEGSAVCKAVLSVWPCAH